MHTIHCPNLEETLSFFTKKLNFRLDMIMPADSPRVALISCNDLQLYLRQDEENAEVRIPDSREKVICRQSESKWITGRAGMEYRDLIPGRLDGQTIASHIRLNQGGEVPDYVHYHKIGFQMIFCKAGGTRVVYEDQGPAFWLEPGDCILQPPEIRHRVLEAAAGSEVIEVVCPAIHETWVDHEMTLPTADLRPDRVFGRQKFVRHKSNQSIWNRSADATFEQCDSGIAEATNGLADVQVIRTGSAAAKVTFDDLRAYRFRFYFVLKGNAILSSGESGGQGLSSGDSWTIAEQTSYSMVAAAGTEILSVRVR